MTAFEVVIIADVDSSVDVGSCVEITGSKSILTILDVTIQSLNSYHIIWWPK